MDSDQNGADQEPKHPVRELVDDAIEQELRLIEEVVERRATIEKQLAAHDERLRRHRERYEALCRWRDEAK
ncbi:hypothetical protein BN948_01765 [Hydrogenophaga intermedia]|uniref:Uncharacterized protein n=1 Tax=Hydrogenophaga intermedia TaxID=65786 RepID=A0A1L1PH81_HYDIT|nr:hypothetical protein [Hydrogenophaga intermedia]CDN87343.1 hypothetical protein BN948_01765 [Hydrogenophaga intermedia]